MHDQGEVHNHIHHTQTSFLSSFRLCANFVPQTLPSPTASKQFLQSSSILCVPTNDSSIYRLYSSFIPITSHPF
jgi:hypothetical protein